METLTTPEPTAEHSRVRSASPQTLTRLARAVTIRAEANKLYRFWRDLTRLPEIIHHPAEIRQLSATQSHWTVSAPVGKVEWDAEITRDEPGRLIAWQTRSGGLIEGEGTIEFLPAPGEEGTEVLVSIAYEPPGGKIGAGVAKFTRDSADSQIYDALKRFKALIEAGEIPTTKGQPVGGPQRPRKGES